LLRCEHCVLEASAKQKELGSQTSSRSSQNDLDAYWTRSFAQMVPDMGVYFALCPLRRSVLETWSHDNYFRLHIQAARRHCHDLNISGDDNRSAKDNINPAHGSTTYFILRSGVHGNTGRCIDNCFANHYSRSAKNRVCAAFALQI
jgi:hypothetical protein